MSQAMVDLTADDGGQFSAYLAMPTNPNGGSVVVLQEIFGINANIRGIADQFAAEGFFAIAPDLFWRQEPGVELNPALEGDRDRAQALLKGLDADLAVRDAMVAGRHLLGLDGANGKLGAVGYCLGGKLAFLMSMQSEVAAAVSYYGVAIQHILGLADKISASLLLHIAQEDHLCPPEAQAQIAQVLGTREGVTIMSYPGVGHAFARRGGQAFDADSAARADTATMELLHGKLG